VSINELAKILVFGDQHTIFAGSETDNFLILHPSGELADCEHVMPSVS
jgi:hypothetical protein